MAERANGPSAGAKDLHEFSLVPEPGKVLLEFPVGRFCLAEHSPDSFACGVIACIGARYLVFFPSEAWAKTVRDRKLPPGALEKALHVQVAACILEDRSAPIEGVLTNLWIGWLKPGLENYFDFGEVGDPSFYFVARGTEEACLPFAQALFDVAAEKFSLQDVLNPIPVETRMAAIEGRFNRLEAGLNELLTLQRQGAQDVGDGGFATAAEEEAQGPQANGPAGRVTKLHLRPPAQRAQKADPVEAPPGLGAHQKYPGMDPTAVAAALQAGIPEEQLRAMSRVLSRKPGRLEDYPRPNGGAQHVLDEDLEEEDQELPEVNMSGLDPVSQALVKLTGIVDQLAVKKKADPMEDLLTGVSLGDAGSTEGSSSSLGKKHAATRLALSKLLRDRPEKIWQVMERNMEEDFHLQTVRPNSGGASFSARGWAEHRSRIAGYPRTVRAVWGVAGILDCFRQGQTDAARSRACITLAQFEQESIDHGSYLLAQEFAMEPPPPIAAFQQHTVPDPMELAATRLMNVSWVEAYTDRLKQVDNYMEMRRKLNGKSKGNQAPPGGDAKTSKGKGDGKGKSKAKKAEKADEHAE